MTPRPGDAVGDVVRGGLAFDRRIQGQDQFLTRFQSGNQALDRQILGADAVERRQGSAEDVIAAAKSAGAFERPKIREIFDDADDALFTPGVAANRTGLDRVEIAADRAGANRLGRFGQRRSERRQQALPPLDQVQRRAPSRAGPEARKLGQQLDQGVEFGQNVRTAVSCPPAAGARRSASAFLPRRERQPCAAHRRMRRRSGLPAPRRPRG